MEITWEKVGFVLYSHHIMSKSYSFCKVYGCCHFCHSLERMNESLYFVLELYRILMAQVLTIKSEDLHFTMERLSTLYVSLFSRKAKVVLGNLCTYRYNINDAPR